MSDSSPLSVRHLHTPVKLKHPHFGDGHVVASASDLFGAEIVYIEFNNGRAGWTPRGWIDREWLSQPRLYRHKWR